MHSHTLVQSVNKINMLPMTGMCKKILITSVSKYQRLVIFGLTEFDEKHDEDARLRDVEFLRDRDCFSSNMYQLAATMLYRKSKLGKWKIVLSKNRLTCLV